MAVSPCLPASAWACLATAAACTGRWLSQRAAPFSVDDLDAAAAWLDRHSLVKGIMIDQCEGPVHTALSPPLSSPVSTASRNFSGEASARVGSTSDSEDHSWPDRSPLAEARISPTIASTNSWPVPPAGNSSSPFWVAIIAIVSAMLERSGADHGGVTPNAPAAQRRPGSRASAGSTAPSTSTAISRKRLRSRAVARRASRPHTSGLETQNHTGPSRRTGMSSSAAQRVHNEQISGYCQPVQDLLIGVVAFAPCTGQGDRNDLAAVRGLCPQRQRG